MRSLKFRAWSNEHNRYCDFVTLDENGRWIGWIKSSGVYLTTADIVLEQYTGLKDKNGMDMYEGDIVDIGIYGKYQIVWDEWACKFDFSKIGEYMRERPLLSQDWEQKVTIIGNIHENPELLGGSE